MIRTFIAIELPPPVREQLARVQEQLRRDTLDLPASWPRVENIHLTLQFLGPTEQALVPRISAALTAVAQRQTPFAVTVAGVGAFPNLDRPQVVWVGCQDAAGRLRSLAAAIQTAMQTFQYQPDRREFTPHLTLARLKAARAGAALTKRLGSLRDCTCGTLPVNAFHLFQSQLHPHGSIYTQLSSHPLQGD